jgi:hypothetical protein
MRVGIVFLAVVLVALAAQAVGASFTSPSSGVGPISGTQYSTSYCLQGGVASIAAPWYCSQINQAVASIWQQWEPIAVITIMVAFMIAAVIFAIGIAIRNQRVKDFGMGEIYEAVATAFIAVFFLTLAAILFGVIPAYTAGSIDPYNTSLSYISSTINSSGGLLSSILNVVIIDYFYSSISIEVNVSNVPQTVAGLPARAIASTADTLSPYAPFILAFFIEPAKVVGDLLIDALVALEAEFYMILFFMYIAIPVFLIPGIIFRAIFPLRSVGGMLIGAAFAFYVVMPLLFSVAYYFTNTSQLEMLNSASAAVSVNGAGTLAQTNAASPMAPLVTEMTGLESSMGGFFLSILFYPALILAITYTAMTTVADFIGGAAKRTGRMALV